MKTTIFNLIILDESGSMDCVRKQTISGCNETINTIRAAQKKFPDTQKHFVSIYAFQAQGDRPSRYLVKNEPVENIRHITERDYEPDGATPLYDAVGATLTDLKSMAKIVDMPVGNVTIITDGMENSSHRYTLGKVCQMIDALKEMGWSFNFIGANIDVDFAAKAMHIDNALEYEQSDEGTARMFANEQRSRMRWFDRANSVMQEYVGAAPSTVAEQMREAAKGYFDEEEEKEK